MGFLIMEVKQYTKVLVWDRSKCRGFLIMGVKQYTKVLIWGRNKFPEYGAGGFLINNYKYWTKISVLNNKL